MKRKQITNKELQDTLKLYDDDYTIQLGIGEEGDLLTHLFIDSDNGVIDLTNFEDENETQIHLIDALKNNIYNGDHILMYYGSSIEKGILSSIKSILLDNKQQLEYSVKFLNRDNQEITITFVTETGITNNLVKFNW